MWQVIFTLFLHNYATFQENSPAAGIYKHHKCRNNITIKGIPFCTCHACHALSKDFRWLFKILSKLFWVKGGAKISKFKGHFLSSGHHNKFRDGGWG